MRSIAVRFLAIVILMAISFGVLECTTTRNPPSNDVDLWDIDGGRNPQTYDSLSWVLLKKIFTMEATNFVISPIVAKLALAVLFEAVRSKLNTENELTPIFTFDRHHKLRTVYRDTLLSLKGENPFYEMHLETCLFMTKLINPQEAFQYTAEAYYGTKVRLLDFQNSNESANLINEWVQQAAKGTLEQFATGENVANSVMLLMNVIYFEGQWHQPFCYNNTFEGPFTTHSNQIVMAQFMTQTEYLYFDDSNPADAEIIRLPFKGGRFALLILLSKSGNDLDDFFRFFSNNQLKLLRSEMKKTKVKVTIPKFKLEYTACLKSAMQSLGIRKIFTNAATFAGLEGDGASSGLLRVSNIIQRAGIIFNEQGTTTDSFAANRMPTGVEEEVGDDEIKEFTVNRPFIFLIEDETTGKLISFGKVVDPTL